MNVFAIDIAGAESAATARRPRRLLPVVDA